MARKNKGSLSAPQGKSYCPVLPRVKFLLIIPQTLSVSINVFYTNNNVQRIRVSRRVSKDALRAGATSRAPEAGQCKKNGPMTQRDSD